MNRLQPTTSFCLSEQRAAFAGMAFVRFIKRLAFNYSFETPTEFEDWSVASDLSDLTGSMPIIVAPLTETESGRPFGLSMEECMQLCARKQVTFSSATCVWHPEWPCLALASFTPYTQVTQNRFRGTDFNLPDEIGFS
jgi:hypothetical protein